MSEQMITENQVPATLVLQIEAMIAVGGLSPAQAGTFRQAADRIEKQDKRISELEAKLDRVREIRQNVKGGIEASAGLDDEIGVYWQETFLDIIDKALADD